MNQAMAIPTHRLEELRVVRFARVAMMEQFVAANLKKFPVSPEETENESAMTSRLLRNKANSNLANA